MIPKPPLEQKKQAHEWDELRFPAKVFDKVESRWSVNSKNLLLVKGFCKISLDRVFKSSGGSTILCLQRMHFFKMPREGDIPLPKVNMSLEEF